MRAKGVCITVLVILVLIALIGGVFVFWGGNKTKKSVKNKEKSKQAERQSNTTAKNKKIKQTPAKPYRATLVMSKDGACDAAKVIAGTVFLDSEGVTPGLPLPGCDVAQCGCRYVHRDDRRDSDDDDRRLPAVRTELYDRTGNINRRQLTGGRRRSD